MSVGVVSTMKPVEARLRQILVPEMLATDIAEYLVRKGLPFRETHHIAGKIKSSILKWILYMFHVFVVMFWKYLRYSNVVLHTYLPLFDHYDCLRQLCHTATLYTTFHCFQILYFLFPCPWPLLLSLLTTTLNYFLMLFSTNLCYFYFYNPLPIGAAVKLAETKGVPLDKLTLEDLQTLDPKFEEDVMQLWGYENRWVGCRVSGCVVMGKGKGGGGDVMQPWIYEKRWVGGREGREMVVWQAGGGWRWECK